MNRLLLVAALAAGAGCDKVSVTPTANPVDVSGTVPAGGKPLANVRVRAMATERGGPFGMTAGPDGKFSGKVVPGKYSWFVEPPGGADKKPDPAFVKAVPEKYREAHMERIVEVKGGETLTLTVE